MTDKSDVENEDKKVIGDEEREKMLNQENIIREETKEKVDEITKENELEKEKEAESEKEKEDKGEDTVVKTGEVEKMKKQLEESQKENRGRIRVPIGGIKIPGFLRSRSRDKNKEGEGTTEEGADLLEAGGEKPEKTETSQTAGVRATLQRGLESLSSKNPFGRKQAKQPVEGEEQEQPQQQKTLLDRIKQLPPINVIPKRFRKDEKPQDAEQGGAELASVETLEDGKPASPDDGMESVKLDSGDEKTDGKDVEKAGLAGDGSKLPIHLQLLQRYERLTKHEKTVAGGIILLLLLIIIIVISTAGGPHPTAPPVVNGKVVTTTQCGAVEGLEEEGVFIFRGIPYAAPPLDKRRWKPAQPLNTLDLCWNETLFLAHNNTKQCWQEFSPDKIDGYENCLNLDIYTPEVRYVNPVPVVVLIDAATLLGGSTGVLTPTPSLLKTREVVFVKPNFRLGILGFLAASPLSEAVHPPSSGNYGLSDIIVALKWIETNIAHFGGDPKQVTLLGHRAGATLVTALATSPAAKGLFKQAWTASGSSMFPGEVVQLTEQDNQGYVDSVCQMSSGKLDCLLGQGVETLIENMDDSWRQPVADLPAVDEDTKPKHNWLVLDGNILQTHVWSESSVRHAQLVVGTTAQSEASAALWELVQKSSSEEEAIVRHVRSSALGKLGLTEEALNRYNSTWKGLVSMVSDIRTVCPLLVMARSQPNVTFYVATLERNHTDFGAIADVDLDVSAILGRYQPHTPAQQHFVTNIQKLFYRYVEYGERPSAISRSQPVLDVSTTSEWKDDYPNCNFWIEKDVVPKYARRD